jgi:hypothetical protein
LKGIPAGARFDFLKVGLSDVRNHSLDLDGANNSVTMLYGGAAKGRAIDHNGDPIRNFRVLIDIPHQYGPNENVGGYFAGYSGIGVHFTSADGSFVVSGLVAGNLHRVSVVADGHGEAAADRVTAVPVNRLTTTKPVTLRARPPAALRVRAVTTDGKPVAGARVTLVNGQPGLDQSFSWGYHDASWEDMVRGRTSADGWVDFPTLSFSGATVLVQAPGYARRRLGWRDAREELIVELALEAVIAGEVRNASGAPVKSFYVNLTSGGDQVSATIGADDNGRFRIAELPAGNWNLRVRSAGSGGGTLHEEPIGLTAGEFKEFSITAKRE